VAALERARQLNPKTHVPISWSAAAYAQAGKIEQARAAIEELRKLRPDLSLSTYEAYSGRSGISVKSKELVVDGLRKAGLPE